MGVYCEIASCVVVVLAPFMVTRHQTNWLITLVRQCLNAKKISLARESKQKQMLLLHFCVIFQLFTSNISQCTVCTCMLVQ